MKSSALYSSQRQLIQLPESPAILCVVENFADRKNCASVCLHLRICVCACARVFVCVRACVCIARSTLSINKGKKTLVVLLCSFASLPSKKPANMSSLRPEEARKLATAASVSPLSNCQFCGVVISSIADEQKLEFTNKYKRSCTLLCSYDSQGVVLRVVSGKRGHRMFHKTRSLYRQSLHQTTTGATCSRST